MGAYFKNNQTICDFARNFEPKNTIITTREEHETCVKDIVYAAADNYVANDSVPTVCQPRPNAQIYTSSCPCWESVAALPAPTKVPFEAEKYILWYGSRLSARVDIGDENVLTADTLLCTGPGTRARPSREEHEVCYYQILEYAKYYNSTNRCHDPWREKEEDASLHL